LASLLHGLAERHGVGLEGAGLVREHDRLNAVAKVQLVKDVRDVRFDSGLADVQLAADLSAFDKPRAQVRELPSVDGSPEPRKGRRANRIEFAAVGVEKSDLD
jgi:hypothetical protein